LSSFSSQSNPVFETSFSKPGPALSSIAGSPATPPFFFIQTECGRFIDSSLPQGIVLSDYQSAGLQGQLFSMSADGIITDVSTQRVLDCRDVRKGSAVVLMHSTGSSSQRWKIGHDGSISLLDAALCLDVKGSVAALAPIIVWKPHGRSNQRFRIVSAPHSHARCSFSVHSSHV
jgi:hypothetical protein